VSLVLRRGGFVPESLDRGPEDLLPCTLRPAGACLLVVRKAVIVMRADVGDRIVVHGRTLDDPQRDGEVLEVHGADGAPPYLVKWEADGHIGLFFPGPDAHVQHFPPLATH